MKWVRFPEARPSQDTWPLVFSLVSRFSDFLQVGRRRPALGVRVGGHPDVPPAGTADLDELDDLVLREVDLPAGEGHVVGQNEVPVARPVTRRHPAPTLLTTCDVIDLETKKLVI